MAKIQYNNKILVSNNNYDLSQDNRFLVPFIQGTKIGFVNHGGDIIIEPKFEFVLDDFDYESAIIRVGNTYAIAYERKTKEPSVYLRKRFGLLNTKGELVLPIEYEGICMPICSSRITIRSIEKGYAVIDYNGNVIVPFGTYDYIDGFEADIARVKIRKDNDSLWGIIDENGKVVLPIEYSNIWNFYNKNRQYTRVEKGDTIQEFHIFKHKLFPHGTEQHENEEFERQMRDYESLMRYREETYEEFNGSYAQDVMGFSDQDIYDVFEGDPDAYWNID